jgi:hypothetical protein
MVVTGKVVVGNVKVAVGRVVYAQLLKGVVRVLTD